MDELQKEIEAKAVAPRVTPSDIEAEIGRKIARENAEREIQANSHHSGCKGERCMASAANGSAHSRECIDEAGEAQGWTPTAEDYAKCGPSADVAGVGYELRTKLAGSKA